MPFLHSGGIQLFCISLITAVIQVVPVSPSFITTSIGNSSDSVALLSYIFSSCLFTSSSITFSIGLSTWSKLSSSFILFRMFSNLSKYSFHLSSMSSSSHNIFPLLSCIDLLLSLPAYRGSSRHSIPNRGKGPHLPSASPLLLPPLLSCSVLIRSCPLPACKCLFFLNYCLLNF